MSHISQDIKDLLNKDKKNHRWGYKIIVFLALVGLVAIIVGASMTCGNNHKDETPATLELGR